MVTNLSMFEAFVYNIVVVNWTLYCDFFIMHFLNIPYKLFYFLYLFGLYDEKPINPARFESQMDNEEQKFWELMNWLFCESNLMQHVNQG